MKRLFRIIILVYLLLALLQGCTYDIVPGPQDCSAPPSHRLVSVLDAGCYRVNGQKSQSEGTFSGLTAGNHTVMMEDGVAIAPNP